MEMWESARLRGAAATMFFNTVHQMEDAVPANRELARDANRLGLLNPPMLTNTRLDNISRTDQVLSPNTAKWTGLALEKEKKAEAEKKSANGTVEDGRSQGIESQEQ